MKFTDRTQEKIEKLLNVIHNSEGAEVDVATNLLSRILSILGHSIEDYLKSDLGFKEDRFEDLNTYEALLIVQLIRKYLNTDKPSKFYRIEGNDIYVKMSKVLSSKFRVDFYRYTDYLEEDLTAFTHAFIAKNQLYDELETSDEDQEMSDITGDEFKKRVQDLISKSSKVEMRDYLEHARTSGNSDQQ